MDQIGEATFQIFQIQILEGSVIDPKARDTIGMGIPGEDTLGSLNPDHTGPIFPQADLVSPDLEPIIRDLLDDAQLRIAKAVQEAQDENTCRGQAWSSTLEGHFRSVSTANWWGLWIYTSRPSSGGGVSSSDLQLLICV